MENDCLTLIAKGEYVYRNRNLWLHLPVASVSRERYDKQDLKGKLPEIIKEIEKGRAEIEQSGVKKMAEAMRERRRN